MSAYHAGYEEGFATGFKSALDQVRERILDGEEINEATLQVIELFT